MRLLDNGKAILFIRGERPILDDKYDLMRHPNIRFTEDGGAAGFDYAQAPSAQEDMSFDPDRYEDYELLTAEDMLGDA